MNIKQANSIVMSILLDKLGFLPTTTNETDSWYLSPFRQERTASFHVNIKKNVWFDHGAGEGGTVVDFAVAYLKNYAEDHTVMDALRLITNMIPIAYKIPACVQEGFSIATSRLLPKSIRPLQHTMLLNYVRKRGIAPALAKKYLKEIYVHNKNSGKCFFALGFKNEDNGFELRNEIMMSCIAPKTITFIRGTKPLTLSINVFEGFFDFLSALTIVKKDRFDEDCIILNSVSCLPKALPYINNYGYRNLYSWMDNDAAGKKATILLEAFAKQQSGLKHLPMNKHYTELKDVNELLLSRTKQRKP